MINHLAALLLAIMVCILCPASVSAQETPYVIIEDTSQYSIDVLCDLKTPQELNVEISYRGDRPSVAFITPSGAMCEVNRMHWTFTDGKITVKIPNAEAGKWYAKTLVSDKQRIHITCNVYTPVLSRESKISIGSIMLVLLIGSLFCLSRLRTRHFYE